MPLFGIGRDAPLPLGGPPSKQVNAALLEPIGNGTREELRRRRFGDRS